MQQFATEQHEDTIAELLTRHIAQSGEALKAETTPLTPIPPQTPAPVIIPLTVPSIADSAEVLPTQIPSQSPVPIASQVGTPLMLGASLSKMTTGFFRSVDRALSGTTASETKPKKYTSLTDSKTLQRMDRLSTKLEQLEKSNMQLEQLAGSQVGGLRFALAEHRETLTELQSSHLIDVERLKELENNLATCKEDIAEQMAWYNPFSSLGMC
ncbi:MAG TPA: hypothetical protein VG895_00045 [Patescibacteria group bacterium]|nr:hypothetical protein [Gammaproteobacteria bacterium]HWA51433.1 hypothetical protein [Patescibacteria group bacterium]